jgi:hypothetical protein
MVLHRIQEVQLMALHKLCQVELRNLVLVLRNLVLALRNLVLALRNLVLPHN